MEGQSGLSELSLISWVSAVEGCLLSGVPLYRLALEKVVIVDTSVSLPAEVRSSISDHPSQ